MIQGRIVQLTPPSIMANIPAWFGWESVGYGDVGEPNGACFAVGVPLPSQLDQAIAQAMTQISRAGIEALRRGDAKLLLDYSEEALSLENANLEGMYETLLDARIPARNVYLANQNLSFDAQHTDYCQGKGIAPVHIVTADLMSFRMLQLTLASPGEMERSEAFQLRVQRIKRGERSQHSFVCMNNLAKSHRLGVALFLVGHRRFSRGRLSFAVAEPETWTTAEDDFVKRFPSSASLLGNMVRLKNLTPLIIDENIGTEKNRLSTVFSIPYKPYMDSLMSICTESEMYGLSYQRITEKSFKTMMMGIPSLIVGNPLSLKRLRGYGFETFSPFIDESYDEEESADRRLAMIFSEARRILGFNAQQQIKFEMNMLEISEHNFYAAKKTTMRNFENFYETIFSRIFAPSASNLPQLTDAPQSKGGQ